MERDNKTSTPAQTGLLYSFFHEVSYHKLIFTAWWLNFVSYCTFFTMGRWINVSGSSLLSDARKKTHTPPQSPHYYVSAHRLVTFEWTWMFFYLRVVWTTFSKLLQLNEGSFAVIWRLQREETGSFQTGFPKYWWWHTFIGRLTFCLFPLSVFSSLGLFGCISLHRECWSG